LSLESGSSSRNISFSVNNLTITAAGSITVDYPTCSPYGHAPDLTIAAVHDVIISGHIDLHGKTGKGEPIDAECNSCFGTDGGDLSITANNITINDYIHTWGGSGSYMILVDPYCDAGGCYPGQRAGCSAGDGGNITLSASSSINTNATGAIDQGAIKGGSGGYRDGIYGDDGLNGSLNWSAPSISIDEISGDLNSLDYNAQVIDYDPLRIDGHVSYNEESFRRGNSGTLRFKHPDTGYTDWIEDIYLIDLKTPQYVTITLSPLIASSDVELYMLNSDAQRTVMGWSINGLGASENLNGTIPAGKYYIGVSYADDLTFGPSTNYILTLGP